MKLLVASVLRGSFATRVCIVVITTTALLAVMVSAQTTKRRSSKRSVNKRKFPTLTSMTNLKHGVARTA